VAASPRVPRANDPSWATASRPLREFLDHEKGRSWDDILEWAKKSKMDEELVRNMLAWLYIEKWASYTGKTKRWKKAAQLDNEAMVGR
jgi:hypothetical protein